MTDTTNQLPTLTAPLLSNPIAQEAQAHSSAEPAAIQTHLQSPIQAPVATLSPLPGMSLPPVDTHVQHVLPPVAAVPPMTTGTPMQPPIGVISGQQIVVPPLQGMPAQISQPAIAAQNTAPIQMTQFQPQTQQFQPQVPQQQFSQPMQQPAVQGSTFQAQVPQQPQQHQFGQQQQVPQQLHQQQVPQPVMGAFQPTPIQGAFNPAMFQAQPALNGASQPIFTPGAPMGVAAPPTGPSIMDCLVAGMARMVTEEVLPMIVAYVGQKGLQVSVDELVSQLRLPGVSRGPAAMTPFTAPTQSKPRAAPGIPGSATPCAHVFTRGNSKGQTCPKAATLGAYCATHGKNKGGAAPTAGTFVPGVPGAGAFMPGAPAGMGGQPVFNPQQPAQPQAGTKLSVKRFDPAKGLFEETSHGFIVAQNNGVTFCLGKNVNGQVVPISEQEAQLAAQMQIHVPETSIAGRGQAQGQQQPQQQFPQQQQGQQQFPQQQQGQQFQQPQQPQQFPMQIPQQQPFQQQQVPQQQQSFQQPMQPMQINPYAQQGQPQQQFSH
jgi:hypothetical protein